MNRVAMDWDLCKTFVAVAETRGFAAAARQLRSSHPTVGRKIAELEGQLGIPLFARSNEGLSLTAQGRKFREHVEAMAAAALRAEAAVARRPVDSGEENLIGRKVGRLGTGFYASRDYAARRRLPERRDEWKDHSVIGFADRLSNERLARWSDAITRQGSMVMRCSSQGDMLAAARAGLGISALSCFVAAAYPDLVRVAPQ